MIIVIKLILLLYKNPVLQKYDNIGEWAQRLQLNGDLSSQQKLLVMQLELWKFCVIGSGYASTFVNHDGLYFWIQLQIYLI